MKLYDYEKKHVEELRRYLPECTVLLKCDGSFPIDEPCKVALYGSGARHTIKGGTGSGEVYSRYFVTVEQGLKNAGFTITTDKWLDGYDAILEQAHKDFIKAIKRRAKENHTVAAIEGMGAVMPEPEYRLPLDAQGDIAVYVLARISGEGNDRNFVNGDILLSETEKRDILALNKHFKKFLLVLNVGGPVDLSEVNEVQNILLLSQLGVETGDALADIILGKANPSGKLTTSWADQKDQPVIGEFGDKDDTRYNEGIYVGYRYYDSVGIRNKYHFGYGLSYTRFDIACKDVNLDESKVTVTAEVKNIGYFSGKEAVQLYISVPEGKLDQPYQMLVAFAKTNEIMTDSSDEVTLTFDMRDIASYSEEDSSYILEQGEYILRLGNSSVNTTVCGVIDLDADVVTVKTKKTCGVPDFKDYRPERTSGVVLPVNVKRMELSASTLGTQTIEYDKDVSIEDFIDKLTDEQLAYINVGGFDPSVGFLNVIGEASSHVAGAAGETTTILEDKGLPVLVMADGPAGVRIAQRAAYADGKAYSVSGNMVAGMEDFLPKPLLFLMKLTAKKPPKNAKVVDQYATAIPIGTAIAQSFNLDFAYSCGDIVGDEMERFGVHLWLAPALNIHRSIRCGRNFEYYSEDPLVSGLFAASITNGVQKHKGCGTTIKHYAANNQETSRYDNNSMVSERAMREIYLKGFGICVRLSQPKAVMTSYNLLNGVHTSQRRDLIEDILRSEFGFKGIVMTDWVVAMMNSKNAKYPAPVPYKVAMAGGDLFMPGGKKDYDNILEGLKSGELDRNQIKINASRVYRMAHELVD